MQMLKNTDVGVQTRLFEILYKLDNSKLNLIEGCCLYDNIFQYDFDNGLSLLIIPNKNAKEKYIYWNFKCGSLYNSWKVSNKEYKVRFGIPKFVEYEMLERKIDLELIKDNISEERKEILNKLKKSTFSQSYKNYTTYALKTDEIEFNECLAVFLELIMILIRLKNTK